MPAIYSSSQSKKQSHRRNWIFHGERSLYIGHPISSFLGTWRHSATYSVFMKDHRISEWFPSVVTPPKHPLVCLTGSQAGHWLWWRSQYHSRLWHVLLGGTSGSTLVAFFWVHDFCRGWKTDRACCDWERLVGTSQAWSSFWGESPNFCGFCLIVNSTKAVIYSTIMMKY